MKSNLAKKRLTTQCQELQFIRPITHSDHILNGKLTIPRKFMREYGSALSGYVLVKVPTGMTWKVALIKSGNDTLFGRGWEEFVRYHGIAYGHMILFHYEDGCSFQAFIFDMTTTEIMYPRGSMNTAGELEEGEGEGEGEGEEDDDDDDNEYQKGEECKLSKYKTRSGQSLRRKLTREKKANVLRRADAFSSENAFFKVLLQPTYILNGYAYLPIPFSFSKLHLREKCVGATLSCGSGRTWPVGFRKSKTQTRITSGWAGFVKDNGLEAGDICLFEMIKATEELSFKVVIFRGAKDARLP